MSITKEFDAVISSTIYQENGFKDYRFIAEQVANSLGFTVLRNSEKPGATQQQFENCMKNDFPIFIALIGEKLTENVKNEYQLALKLGLPIITLIKTESDNIISTPVKNNLCSISRYIYEKDCSTFCDCESLYISLKNRLLDYNKTFRQNKINLLKSRSEIYPYTTNMICQAKHLVVLCQKSSTLLLGSRNIDIEERCYSELTKWVELADNKMHFIHIFSKKYTLKELKNNEYTSINKAKEKLLSIMQKTKANISLRTSETLNPCVVADHNMLFSLQLGNTTQYVELPGAFISSKNAEEIINPLKQSGTFYCSNNSENVQNMHSLINKLYS
ncbi:MAG: hypothetical protein HDQ97_15470 [Lachnospiraceae bacterium]|nr:hypothetical protein [Lachnospiraceae bacterium]